MIGLTTVVGAILSTPAGRKAALIGAVHAPTATIVAGLSDLIPD